jgi:ribosome-associated protein
VKLPSALERAIDAARSKKAEAGVVLDLRKVSAFTDYFLLVSGQNQKQMQAIADAVLEALRADRLRPDHIEGYPKQEWILLDYSDFVVHIFSPRTRGFYDLERLWGGAARIEVA